MRVAYRQGEEPVRARRISAKRAFHESALRELDMNYAKDAVAAKRKFANKIAELKALEEKLKELQSR